MSPDGRFAVFIGLWAFIAGIALFTNQTTVDAARPYPAICAVYRGRIGSVMGGCSLGQTPEVWSRWSQLEALHCAVTQSDQSISRWMSSSVIGLSPR